MSKPFFNIPNKPPSYTKYSTTTPTPASPFQSLTPSSNTNTFGSLIQSSGYQNNTYNNQQMSQSSPSTATTFNYTGIRNTFTNPIAPSNHGIQASQQMTDRPVQPFGNLSRSNSPQGSSNKFLNPLGQNAFGGYTSNRLNSSGSSFSPNISPNYPKSLNTKLTNEGGSTSPSKVLVKCIAATEENVKNNKTKEMLRI